MDDRQIAAELLRRRLYLLAWWREALRVHPGGLVPVGTAARILGVSRQRVAQLIAAGRIPVLDMPGPSKLDRFIPADALLMIASRADQGRPLRPNPDKGYPTRRVPTPNIYGSTAPTPPSVDK